MNNATTKSQSNSGIKVSSMAILLSLFALLASTLPLLNDKTTSFQNASKGEVTLYEKVNTSGILRIGYTVYPPGVIKTPDGKLRGIAVDVLNEVANRLKLKTEWVEEVGWATQIEGLKTNRYDIIGTAVWPNPKRAKLSTLSRPLFYSPLYLYARVEDNRYPDGFDLSKLNDAAYRISAIEGATAETIIKGSFPNAARVTLPESADVAQSFLDVTTNKADLLITEPYNAMKFHSSQSNAVKNILPRRPLRVFGNCFMFKPNEPAFQNMLNEALEDLHNSGFVDSKIKQYEAELGTGHAFYRVAPGYIITE
jgi:polar amino acid transport system substrate-binding protein